MECKKLNNKNFLINFNLEVSVFSSVVVIASEDVLVAGQFSGDLFSNDVLVAVQADSACWWT